MQFIKAKFIADNEPYGRSYTYKTEDDVKAGDIVTISKGPKLIVVDEPVDMTWVETYGADKIGVVKKYVEPIKEYRIVDIRDVKTKETRTDGRYPLRIGRIVKEPKAYDMQPMVLEYLRNADGSDYSGMFLRTSLVMESFVNENGNLIVVTMNSEYEFEPVKEESDE